MLIRFTVLGVAGLSWEVCLVCPSLKSSRSSGSESFQRASYPCVWQCVCDLPYLWPGSRHLHVASVCGPGLLTTQHLGVKSKSLGKKPGNAVPGQPWEITTVVFHLLLPSVHPDARGGDSYTTSRWDDASHSPQAFPELAWDLSLPHHLVCHSTMLSSLQASLLFLTTKAHPCLCPHCLLQNILCPGTGLRSVS